MTDGTLHFERRSRKVRMTAAAVSIALITMSVSDGLVAASNAPRPEPSMTMQDVDGDITTQFARLQQLQSRLPAAGFDVAAQARALGPDVGRIFAFVRDEIAYDVYPGVLRGALGTLLGRAGNSVDKSVLLAALLRANGLTVRFVSGTLDDTRANQLVTRMLQRRLAPSNQAAVDAAIQRALGTLPPDGFAATFAAKQSEMRDLIRKVDADRQQLLRGLADNGVSLAGDWRAQAGALARETKTHVWVEYERNGWHPLDASFPDARPDQTFATGGAPLPDLPESLYQHVTFRVRIEQQVDSALTVKTLMESTLRSADLVGASVTLTNAPNYASDDYSLAALKKTSKFLPTLTVDGKLLCDNGFDLKGNVIPNAEFAPGAAGAVSSLFGAFGRALEDSSPRTLTAEWLDVVTSGPDMTERSYTRDIVDRIGVDNRGPGRSNAIRPAFEDEVRLRLLLATQHLISVEPAFLPEGFVLRRQVAQMLARKDLLVAAVQARRAGTPQAQAAFARLYARSENTDLSPELLSLSLATRRLGERLVEDRYPTATFYHATPAVAIYESRLDAAPGGRVVIQRGFDIIAHEFRVLVANDVAKAKELHLALGVTETHLERLLAADFRRVLVERLGDDDALAEVDGVERLLNTTDVFAVAALDGIRTSFVDRQRGDALAGMAVSAQSKARIRQDVDRGLVVFAPSRSVTIYARQTLGWWRIDPRTGATLGMMESGEGQALTEYVTTVARASLSAIVWVARFFCAVVGYVFIAAIVLDLVMAFIARGASGVADEIGNMLSLENIIKAIVITIVLRAVCGAIGRPGAGEPGETGETGEPGCCEPADGKGCFVRGTLVDTPNGPTPIQAIAVGDLVLSRDEAGGPPVYHRVSGVTRDITHALVDLDVGGRIVTATPDHRFKVAGGAWVLAREIQGGTLLETAHGPPLAVMGTTLRPLPRPVKTFNLAVEHASNFFVHLDRGSILVHNNDFDQVLYWVFGNKFNLRDGDTDGLSTFMTRNTTEAQALLAARTAARGPKDPISYITPSQVEKLGLEAPHTPHDMTVKGQAGEDIVLEHHSLRPKGSPGINDPTVDKLPPEEMLNESQMQSLKDTLQSPEAKAELKTGKLKDFKC